MHAPRCTYLDLYQIRPSLGQSLREGLLWKEEGILPSPLRGLPRATPLRGVRDRPPPGTAGPRREGLM